MQNSCSLLKSYRNELKVFMGYESVLIKNKIKCELFLNMNDETNKNCWNGRLLI